MNKHLLVGIIYMVSATLQYMAGLTLFQANVVAGLLVIAVILNNKD